MKTVGYVCERCGHKFEKEILEPGEAEAKQIQGRRVRCPNCGSYEHLSKR